MMWYFAYGSNLCRSWLRSRTPSASVYQKAILPGHRLYFHKVSSNDNSGKCNAFYTGEQADYVYGVIYHIQQDEIELLDAAEGLGTSYQKEHLKVTLASTNEVQKVTTYLAVASTIDNTIRPFYWYKRLVLVGAINHNFPEQYITRIKNVETTRDTNQARREKNLQYPC